MARGKLKEKREGRPVGAGRAPDPGARVKVVRASAAVSCLVVAGLLFGLPEAAQARRRLKCDIYTAKALGWVKRATRRHVGDCLKHRAGCPDALAEARIAKVIKRAVKRINARCPRPDATIQARSAELEVLCNEYQLCSSFGTMSLRVREAAEAASKMVSRGVQAQAAGAGGAASAPLPAVRVDVGTSGLAHDLRILQGAGFDSELLNCDAESDPVCDIAAHVSGEWFGTPSPITAGGVPVCVTLQFTSDVAGTINLNTGEISESATLEAVVYNGIMVHQPCPACITGSADPALGQAGTCSGGPNDGLPCNVGGLADSGYGQNRATSNDCPPNPGADIGNFRIMVRPATTGEASLGAGLQCTAAGHGAERCWCDTCGGGSDPGAPCASDADCPGGGICGAKHCAGGERDGELCQVPTECGSGWCVRPGQPTQSNACSGGSTDCVPSGDGTGGECASDPVDSVCEDIPFLACYWDDDCPTGSCIERPRSCFLDPIRRRGTPDPVVNNTAYPTLVGTMCFSPSTSSAVNGAAGFPGPLAFIWPAEIRIAH